MLIDGGVYEGVRYLSKETCDLFLTHTSKISRRGLGFDKPDKKNEAKSPCAAEAPAEVVGHTGFTGTCAWADPKNKLVFVFLSNRIYPRPFDHKQLMRLNIRPRIQQVMYQAMDKSCIFVPSISTNNLIFKEMAYVISDDCIACGTCIDECPVGAISEGDKYSINPDMCTECGTCADVCPSEAISQG